MEDSEVSPDSTADTAGVGPTPARGMACRLCYLGQGQVLRFQGGFWDFREEF